MNIIATVGTVDGAKIMVEHPVRMIYHRLNRETIISHSSDLLLWSFYFHRVEHAGPKAFGGSKFSFQLSDGTELESDGWWWSGMNEAHIKFMKERAGKHWPDDKQSFEILRSVGVRDIEGLRSCYVYGGYQIFRSDLERIMDTHRHLNGTYWQVEKLIQPEKFIRQKLNYQEITETPLRKSEVIRSCEICGTPFVTTRANLKRGWGKTCSKKCAAKLREKSKPGYDPERVRANNIRRATWNLNLPGNRDFPATNEFGRLRGYTSEGYGMYFPDGDPNEDFFHAVDRFGAEVYTGRSWEDDPGDSAYYDGK